VRWFQTAPWRVKGVQRVIDDEARKGLVWDEAKGEWVYDKEKARAILSKRHYHFEIWKSPP
jgi:hypothetical protein